MPKAVEALYFVIDEKNRSVDLTDKGIDELTTAARRTPSSSCSGYCRSAFRGRGRPVARTGASSGEER